MTAYIGPLHPKRKCSETKLSFSPTIIKSKKNKNRFGRINQVNLIDEGIVCGLEAITWREGYSQHIIGSCFFVAPGIAITAWHVIKDFLPKNTAGVAEAEFNVISFRGFLVSNKASVWPVNSMSVGEYEGRGSDLTVLGCCLSGSHPKYKSHPKLIISERMPLKGEELFSIGMKQKEPRKWGDELSIEAFESVGVVTDIFENGRGFGLRGPCFALSSGATGGMSGAAVFNTDGEVVGILSSGVEDSLTGYSMVSSIIPALDHQVSNLWNSRDEIKVSSLRNIEGLVLRRSKHDI